MCTFYTNDRRGITVTHAYNWFLYTLTCVLYVYGYVCVYMC